MLGRVVPSCLNSEQGWQLKDSFADLKKEINK